VLAQQPGGASFLLQRDDGLFTAGKRFPQKALDPRGPHVA
jgi:hypothetical protein